MTVGQQRRVSIVVQLEGQRMQGQWRDTATVETHEIAVNGETDIRWSSTVWDAIFSNIQLDTERDACRILIFSDQQVGSNTVPLLKNSWKWEIEEIAQALSDTQKRSVSRWYINRTYLGGRYRKYFPTGDGKAGRDCYICTVPPCELKECSDVRTPLPEIIRDLNKQQSNRASKSPSK